MALLSFFRRSHPNSEPEGKSTPQNNREDVPAEKKQQMKTGPAAADKSDALPYPDPKVSETELTHAVEMFQTIQGVIGKSEDLLELPCAVLLRHLPEELRGPEWKIAGFPAAPIELERKPLLDQLRRGRVTYPLNDLTLNLPEGWVKSDPDAVVEMNLGELVQAMPPELFQVDGRMDQDTVQAAQMRDVFSPNRPPSVEKPEPEVAPAVPAPMPSMPEQKPVEVTQATAAETEPAAVEPATVEPAAKTRKPPVARPFVPSWDGLDRLADAGAQTVDLNRAGADEIANLPAMGPISAQRIVVFRTSSGPFRGIYDLLTVPGIGPKTFCRMTGLDHRLRKRADRHTVLNGWLGLPEDARPPLVEIAQSLAQTLHAAGCVLSGHDGLVLAESGNLGELPAKVAAISPKLFQRTNRYIRRLTREPIHALYLPAADPALLLVLSGVCHVAVIHGPEGMDPALCRKAVDLAREIEWLLSPRAVVRP